MLDVSKLSDKQLLTLLLYGEARGEPVEGQIAVGCCVRNRVRHPRRFGKTWREVILKPKQFSCFNADDPNYHKIVEISKGIFKEPEIIRQLAWIAEGILYELIMDNTEGADHYMSIGLFYSKNHPEWADVGRMTVIKGNHVFFKLY